MNITEEDLNSLSQLDRIEFRQKEDRIEFRQKEDNCYSTFSIMDLAFYILIMATIFVVNGYYDITGSLLAIALFVVVFQIIGWIVCYAVNNLRLSKLKSQYFVVNKKNKK